MRIHEDVLHKEIRIAAMLCVREYNRTKGQAPVLTHIDVSRHVAMAFGVNDVIKVFIVELPGSISFEVFGWGRG